METSDREPKYLGTHRGVARVQIGWTTLYFRGDAYTHALGSLYGTQESPTREEITAARKVIPVVPRPPVMANAPSTKRAASPKTEKAPKVKTSPTERKSTPPAKESAARPKRAEGKPVPPKKSAGPGKAKSTEARKTAAPKTKRTPAEAPIASMAELRAKVEGGSAKANAGAGAAIGSMAELEAQIA